MISWKRIISTRLSSRWKCRRSAGSSIRRRVWKYIRTCLITLSTCWILPSKKKWNGKIHLPQRVHNRLMKMTFSSCLVSSSQDYLWMFCTKRRLGIADWSHLRRLWAFVWRHMGLVFGRQSQVWKRLRSNVSNDVIWHNLLCAALPSRIHKDGLLLAEWTVMRSSFRRLSRYRKRYPTSLKSWNTPRAPTGKLSTQLHSCTSCKEQILWEKLIEEKFHSYRNVKIFDKYDEWAKYL